MDRGETKSDRVGSVRACAPREREQRIRAPRPACAPTNGGGIKHFSCRFPQSPRANPSANIILSPRYTYSRTLVCRGTRSLTSLSSFCV